MAHSPADPCSPAPGSSTAGSTRPGSGTPGSASATRGAANSSPDAGPTPPSTTTSAQLALTLDESTSSQAASPARAQAAQENGTGSSIRRRLFGSSSRVFLASFDPATPSSKTWRQSCLSMTEPSGERFCGTWPRSGSVSGGSAFEHPTSGRLTAGTGSSPSLLPTPNRRDGDRGSRANPERSDDWGACLGQAVALLPTPAAGLHNYDENPQQWQERAERLKAKGINGNGAGMPLAVAVKLLPTPTSMDSTSSRSATSTRKSANYTPGTTLSDVAYEWSGASTSPPSDTGNTSPGQRPRLSPEFVGWMMGTPLCQECGREWTDPQCEHTASAFQPSETASRSRSAGSSESTSSRSSGSGR